VRVVFDLRDLGDFNDVLALGDVHADEGDVVKRQQHADVHDGADHRHRDETDRGLPPVSADFRRYDHLALRWGNVLVGRHGCNVPWKRAPLSGRG